MLAVHTGSCGSFSTVACGDDVGGATWSPVEWTAYAGTTYFIEAAAYGLTGTGGNLKLNLNQQSPANDLCSAAEVIPTVPFMATQSTAAATTSGDDPLQTCSYGGPAQNGHTVWYSYQSASDRMISLDTFGSNYDTVLSVYTGSCGSLTEVACNDDVAGGVLSQLSWLARAGVPYKIEVTRLHGSYGAQQLPDPSRAWREPSQ